MIRVGLGYDSHRFQPPGPLTLGGVTIPFDNHLHGHSDGDAVCHALTDALLGGAALGDIGDMFSDKDPGNKGRNSIEMLSLAAKRVRDKGYQVVNADITIITESPRLEPFKQSMREKLAGAVGVSVDLISVKAKTNEGMGWIGRGEGIACIAEVSLVR